MNKNHAPRYVKIKTQIEAGGQMKLTSINIKTSIRAGVYKLSRGRATQAHTMTKIETNVRAGGYIRTGG